MGLGGFDTVGNNGQASLGDTGGGGGGGGGGVDPATGLGLAGGSGAPVTPRHLAGAAGGAGGSAGLIQVGGAITLGATGGVGADGSPAGSAANTLGSGSGGGGEGGVGVHLTLSALAASSVSGAGLVLRGGVGGAGGVGDISNVTPVPGSGGGGGTALLAAGTGTLTIGPGVQLIGGAGGNAGRAASATVNVVSVAGFNRGGDGGVGLRLGPGVEAVNSGDVIGGISGVGSLPGNVVGGNGVFMTGGHLVNNGLIQSGINAVTLQNNISVRFFSGNASVDLMPGSRAVGILYVDPGAIGTVRMRGSNVTRADVPSFNIFGRGVIDVATGDPAASFPSLITGSGVFEKTGEHVLRIASNNNYSGGTIVSGGTLIGDVTSFGSGGITTRAVLQIDQATNATLVNAVDGTGSLVKSGAGALTLSPTTNNYVGGTRIVGGSLRGQSTSFGIGTITNDALLVIDQPTADVMNNLIAGSGQLVKQGAGTLTLSNGNNSYAGGTVINQGVLSGRSGSFGIGPVTNNAQMVIAEDASGTLPGAIHGAGSVTKTGAGTTTLEGDSDFSAGLVVKAGRVNLGRGTAAGTGVISMDDGTTLGFSADGLSVGNDILLTGTNDPTIDTGPNTATLAGSITGAGDLTKQGAGTLVLAGINSYLGATLVSQGTLRAGAADTLSAASAHTVAAGATLDLAGFSQTVPALVNSGVVSLVGGTPNTTLTVRGPYVGNNGVLRLGTAVGANGLSDRLVIDGPTATASGSTALQIVNLAGLGGDTTGSGIEVVSAINGATTTAQGTRSAFSLAGTVAAGPFIYRLVPADAAGAGENWYLRSTRTVVVVTPVVDPGGSPVPTPPGTPTPAPAVLQVEVPSYRPEASLAVALPSQLRQASFSVLTSRHQRIGDDSILTDGPQPTGRQVWGRALSIDPHIRQDGPLSTRSQGRLTGFQAGTDLWAQGQWTLGVYVAQLDGDAKVSGFAQGVQGAQVGSNDLRNRYLGLYADWRGDDGWYAEAVMQGGQHRYTLHPIGGFAAEGKGRSRLASLEVGKGFDLSPGWKIEPQLQLAHQSQSLDALNIVGSRIDQQPESGLTVRTGVRVRGEMPTSAGLMQPYAALNFYRYSSGRDTTTFVPLAAQATRFDGGTGGHTSELAVGFTLATSQELSWYAELGKRNGSGGASRIGSSVQASAGLKLRW